MHDTSSGAALQCRTMLEKLIEITNGEIEVMALGSFVFDNPRGVSLFTDLKEKLAGKEMYFSVKDHGISYMYVRNHSTFIDDHTGGEQRLFFTKFLDILREFRPDLIMGFGGDMLSMTCRAEAHRRGIPVVYNLMNGNHKGFTFPDCDMVLTDSYGTANFYANNFGINCMSSGIFLRMENVLAQERQPKYITMINPVTEKGVGMFARLALMAQKELPKEKFLVVESRGSFAEGLAKLVEPSADGKSMKHPFKNTMFPNVDVAKHTPNVSSIYALTKVLVCPSLWFEGWGRVASEAVMNGIPVLGSTSGGLPEAIGTAGICLDAPVECQRNYSLIPTEEQARPWMDALKKLLTEDYSKQCQETAASFNPDVSARRALEAISPLLDRHASYSSQYLRGGMLFR